MQPPIDVPEIPAPWSRLLGEPLPKEHVVQLYTDERRLVDAVTHFAGTGLLEGDGVVLVGTPPHVEAFSERLKGAGFDLDAARRSEQLWVIDAASLLSRFMSNGRPEKPAFDAIVGEALKKAGAGQRRVRVFGEMVDLLWRQNLAAAIHLEDLWNAAIESCPISLLCAYCVAEGRDGDAHSLRHFPSKLDRAHSQQIPVEAWA